MERMSGVYDLCPMCGRTIEMNDMMQHIDDFHSRTKTIMSVQDAIDFYGYQPPTPRSRGTASRDTAEEKGDQGGI